MTSSPSSSASVSLRPWVSTTPTTTSTPSLRLRAGASAASRRSCRRRARRRRRSSACRAALLAPRSFQQRLGRRSLFGIAALVGHVARSNHPRAASLDHYLRAARSSARLSASTLTCGSPRRPRKRPSVLLGDELPNPILRQVPRLGDARHLEQRRFRRDVRIEAAGRGRDEVDRHGRVRVLRLQLVDVALDAVDQRLAGRAEVRAAGVGGVVGRRAVLVGSFGSGASVADGRPWKYLSSGEALADQRRSRRPCRPSRSGCLAPGAGRCAPAMPVMASG